MNKVGPVVLAAGLLNLKFVTLYHSGAGIKLHARSLAVGESDNVIIRIILWFYWKSAHGLLSITRDSNFQNYSTTSRHSSLLMRMCCFSPRY